MKNNGTKHSLIHRLLAFMLIAVLVAGILPAAALAAGESESSGNDLVYSKTATARGDGTYDLELTLKGTVATQSNKQKIDLIIVIDRSKSMQNEDGTKKSRMVWAKEAAQGLVDALNDNGAVDARYNIIDFAGSGHPKEIDDAVFEAKGYEVAAAAGWADYAAATGHIGNVNLVGQLYSGDELNGKELYYNQHSTNYEAAFKKVNSQLESVRPDALSVVVYLTDGKPTVAWEEIESDYVDSDGYGRIDEDINWEGRGTTLEGDNNVAKCLDAALDDAALIEADRLYLVGTGTADEVTLNKVKNTASKVGYKEVTTTASSGIKDAFAGIAENLTELAYRNITITDTLSHVEGQLMVEPVDPEKVYVTVYDGDTKIAGPEPSVTLEATERNSAATLKASYNTSTHQLKLDFPDDYKLEPTYTYKLSTVIEPTEKAYREYREFDENYIDSESKKNVGEDNTGTHSGAKGYHSNDGAIIDYTYQNVEGQLSYDHPVVWLTPGTLVITKEITGLTEEQIAALNDLKFDITITYPDDGNGVDDETVTKQIGLSDMTKRDDGIYIYTITGLSPDTIYTVKESGGEVDGYYMTTTVNGSAANDAKSASGNVPKGETVTVAYENDYTPEVAPDTPFIYVKKTFVGIEASQIPEEFKISVTGNGKTYELTLATKDAVSSDGLTYTWKLEGLPAGEYTVTESGEQIDNYEVVTEGIGESVTTKEAAIAFELSDKLTPNNATSWDVSAHFQDAEDRVIIAQLTSPKGYFVWTSTTLSSNQCQAVIDHINHVLNANPNATSDNTYFYSGDRISDANGLFFRGGYIKYDESTGYLTFTAPKQWTMFWAGKYSITEKSHAEIEVTNTYTRNTTSIIVDKIVTGNMGDLNKEFAFTVTATYNGEPVKLQDKDGNEVSGKFKLSHYSDPVTLYNIPVGATVTVTEVTEGYFATVTLNDEKSVECATGKFTFTVADNDPDMVVFKNDKNALIDTGIVMDSLPYVLMLAVCAAGMFLFLRRRRYED